MNRNKLAREIFNVAYLTGKFKLRSGVTSLEYFDKYQFESRPKLLKAIATAMLNLIPSNVEILAGLELGAVPIAAALSLETGLPAIYVRKKAKQYGTAKFAEGLDFAGKKVLVIEDVVTSGGQIILSTNDLRGGGAQIDSAICVIDRQAGGAEKLASQNVALTPLFTMEQIKKAAGAI